MDVFVVDASGKTGLEATSRTNAHTSSATLCGQCSGNRPQLLGTIKCMTSGGSKKRHLLDNFSLLGVNLCLGVSRSGRDLPTASSFLFETKACCPLNGELKETACGIF